MAIIFHSISTNSLMIGEELTFGDNRPMMRPYTVQGSYLGCGVSEMTGLANGNRTQDILESVLLSILVHGSTADERTRAFIFCDHAKGPGGSKIAEELKKHLPGLGILVETPEYKNMSYGMSHPTLKVWIFIPNMPACLAMLQSIKASKNSATASAKPAVGVSSAIGLG